MYQGHLNVKRVEFWPNQSSCLNLTFYSTLQLWCLETNTLCLYINQQFSAGGVSGPTQFFPHAEVTTQITLA